jgi:hypothetical protein
VRILTSLLVVGALACRERPPEAGTSAPGHDATQARGGPTLVPLRSIQLAQSDTLYLGRPVAMTAARDGSLYVVDAFFSRAVHFRPNGEVRRVIGRKGRGPGELEIAVLPALIGDSLLVISDDREPAMSVFDARAGGFLRRVPLDGAIREAATGGSRPTFGLIELGRRTGLMEWDPATNARRYFHPLPQEYLEAPAFAGVFTIVAVDRWADSMLVGYSGLNTLQLLDGAGRAVHTVTVPVRRRKGVSADVVARFNDEKIPFPEKFGMNSALFHVRRLSDGRIALLHYDQQLSGPQITTTAWVSVLSAGLDSACVDGSLPTGKDAQPVTTFAGDTLLVLEQRVGDSTEVEARVTRYRIETAGCRWERM